MRQKLIVSYLFIGFVPALLLAAFFTLAGLVMFRYFSSYLFKSGFDDLIEQIRVQADTAALEIERGAGVASARSVLERKHANLVRRYPGISFALVPIDSTTPDTTGRAKAHRRAGGERRAARSEGTHAVESRDTDRRRTVGALDPPTSLPRWIGKGGFGGAHRVPRGARGIRRRCSPIAASS